MYAITDELHRISVLNVDAHYPLCSSRLFVACKTYTVSPRVHGFVSYKSLYFDFNDRT